MEVQQKCFNEFPDQCPGCPEYSESRPDSSLDLVLLTSAGMLFPQQHRRLVTKECKRFHKRKVEYPE